MVTTINYPPTSNQPDPLKPADLIPYFQRIVAKLTVASMPEEGLQEAFETLVRLFVFYQKRVPTKKPEDRDE